MPDPDALFDVSLEHLEIETRTRDLCSDIWKWLEQTSDDQIRANMELRVLSHFWIFIAGKVYRALMGLRDDADGLDERSDALGSAKVALIGLGETRRACDTLAAAGVMPGATSEEFLKRIDWVIAALNRVLPGANAFVRPGFDEPQELARLEAGELIE